nr:type II toxin-antitoxin system PemK/MazF family toxin [Candidatus Sigynarchaeota archaeon]
MMTFNCGDVVLLPFPFTDLTTSKQRPAVVISSGWFNSNRKDIIVAAITSQVPPSPAKDVGSVGSSCERSPLHHVASSTEPGKGRGTPPCSRAIASRSPKPSLVKVTKLVTIDQALVRKRLGSLSIKYMKKLMKILKKFIG